MKTVYTTLPIYKNRASQYYERGMANGSTIFAPVYTPKHRLPSFQWMDDDDGAATVDLVELINGEGTIDITSYFPTLPSLYTADSGDIYFQYKGDTLNEALPAGAYYLRMTTDNDYVYYSDWFQVDCVYRKLATSFTNISYDTFTISETTVLSAVDAGANAYADSAPYFTVHKDQEITVIFYLTETGATNPGFSIFSATLGVISNVAASSAGLNELTLTATQAADDCVVRMQCTGTTNFSTSEILVHYQYSEDWVTLSFSNCCNLTDLLYEDDFYQTLWLLSDSIEQQFPFVEKGQENGDGRFIPTFRRQDKTYTLRMAYLSQYMIDVLYRLKMHDLITYVDQVGDAFIVEATDVEHEWIEPDKYYATAALTIDCGEEIIATGCCAYT